MVWPPDPPSRTLVHWGAAEAANEIPDQQMTPLGDDIPMIFSMVKMTEVQVSATNSYIPKGGGRGSFLWYSLMKTLTPQAHLLSHPTCQKPSDLGMETTR